MSAVERNGIHERVDILEREVDSLRQRALDISEEYTRRSETENLCERILTVEKTVAAMEVSVELSRAMEKTLRELDKEVASLRGKLVGGLMVVSVVIPIITAVVVQVIRVIQGS